MSCTIFYPEKKGYEIYPIKAIPEPKIKIEFEKKPEEKYGEFIEENGIITLKEYSHTLPEKNGIIFVENKSQEDFNKWTIIPENTLIIKFFNKTYKFGFRRSQEKFQWVNIKPHKNETRRERSFSNVRRNEKDILKEYNNPGKKLLREIRRAGYHHKNPINLRDLERLCKRGFYDLHIKDPEDLYTVLNDPDVAYAKTKDIEKFIKKCGFQFKTSIEKILELGEDYDLYQEEDNTNNTANTPNTTETKEIMEIIPKYSSLEEVDEYFRFLGIYKNITIDELICFFIEKEPSGDLKKFLKNAKFDNIKEQNKTIQKIISNFLREH